MNQRVGQQLSEIRGLEDLPHARVRRVLAVKDELGAAKVERIAPPIDPIVEAHPTEPAEIAAHETDPGAGSHTLSPPRGAPEREQAAGKATELLTSDFSPALNVYVHATQTVTVLAKFPGLKVTSREPLFLVNL
ncbi:hypothetical protein GCM10023081_18540 [Arthrobacter ginkgonis]|uniref:Uncharacterized protein n=1 Tax=Arthrobacter ginkgonis TaxID=1630594 RepID=A0ABP7C8X6_9MICC